MASCGPSNVTAEKAEEVAKSLNFEELKVTKVQLRSEYHPNTYTTVGKTLFDEMKKQYGEGEVELNLADYEDDYFVSSFDFENRGDENYTYTLDGTAIAVNGTVTTIERVSILSHTYSLKTTMTEYVNFNSEGIRTESKYTYNIVDTESKATMLDCSLSQYFSYTRATSSKA